MRKDIYRIVCYLSLAILPAVSIAGDWDGYLIVGAGLAEIDLDECKGDCDFDFDDTEYELALNMGLMRHIGGFDIAGEISVSNFPSALLLAGTAIKGIEVQLGAGVTRASPTYDYGRSVDYLDVLGNPQSTRLAFDATDTYPMYMARAIYKNWVLTVIQSDFDFTGEQSVYDPVTGNLLERVSADIDATQTRWLLSKRIWLRP